MAFVRHFFVGKQYLGSSDDHLRFIHGEAQEPLPYCMFCPTCAEIWARLPVDGSSREWRVISHYCEAHPGPSKYVVHGSLMLNWEPELTAILPADAIRREFELHVRLWEKENAARGE